MPGNEDKGPVRVFVSLKKDRADGSGYRRLVDVKSDKELKAQLIDDARVDMESFTKRYARVREVFEVIEAMDRALAKTGSRTRKSA